MFEFITLWLANGLIVYGLWLVGDRRRSGFVYGSLGSFLWCCFGAATGCAPLVAIEIILISVSVRAWLRWGEDDQDG